MNKQIISQLTPTSESPRTILIVDSFTESVGSEEAEGG